MRGHVYYQRPARSAAHFDGSSYLETTQGILALNSAEGIVSVFIKREPGDKGIVLETVQSQGALVLRVAIHELYHYAFLDIRLGASSFFAAGVQGSLPMDGKWHHLLISWNVNRPMGQKSIGLTIDDRDRLDIVQDNAPAFIPLTSSKRWRVGASIATNPATLRGSIADLYVELGRSLDLSETVNRRVFVSPYGTPIRSASYGTPQLFLNGESGRIAKHAGTAPELTLTGNIPLEPMNI